MPSRSPIPPATPVSSRSLVERRNGQSMDRCSEVAVTMNQWCHRLCPATTGDDPEGTLRPQESTGWFPIVGSADSRHDCDMTGNNSNPSPSTTLRRSKDHKVFAGVCGGLGEHFDINAWWFRWAFIILAFFGLAGIALYVLAWLLIPRADGTGSVAGGWFDELDLSDAGTCGPHRRGGIDRRYECISRFGCRLHSGCSRCCRIPSVQR